MTVMLSIGAFAGAISLGGALAYPASRRLFNKQIEQDWLFKELDIDRIEDDRTIITKSKTYAHVWQIQGLSYESRGENEQQALSELRALLIKDLGELGIDIRFIGRKRRKSLHLYTKWPSKGLQEIGDAEADYYKDGFDIEWFIIISCRNYTRLIEGSGHVSSALSDFGAMQVINDDEGTDLTLFVNYLICGETPKHDFEYHGNLSQTLPVSDLNFDKIGTLTIKQEEMAIWQIVNVKLWPEEVSGVLIRDLLNLNYELEISQTAIHITKAKAQYDFKRKSQQYAMASFLSNSTIAGEFEAASDLLTEDAIAFFDTQFSIAVRTKDEEEGKQAVKDIKDVLGRLRISHSLETRGAPICWFNRHPGRNKLLRPLRLSSDALGALWPFPQAVKGMPSSPFGDAPVRVFRTGIGACYQFQFHNSVQKQSLGHFLVFAPSGSGKSTLIMHLLGGLAKYEDVRSYVFDSKEGVRFMMETMGGLYQGFDELSLNPLDVGEDSKKNRQRIRLVLQAMLGNVELTSDVERQINHAVDLSFKVAPPERTLNNIYEAAFRTQSAGDDSLKQAFSRWVTTHKGEVGAYADIFNAPHDSLGSVLSDQFMVGINMNEALDDPILGPPIISHISQALGQSAAKNNKGFAIFIDEAAKLIENKGFEALVKEMYREFRKNDGLVGMAFQEPSALINSNILQQAKDNTSCYFFFPNPQGRPDDYEGFNLREEELNFIFGGQGLSGGRRCLVVKTDPANNLRESVIINIDLAPLGSALRFYRSGSDAIQTMKQAQLTYGQDWLEEI